MRTPLALAFAVALAAPAVAMTPAESAERAAACWAERDRGFAASGKVDPAPADCAAAGWEAAAAELPARLDLQFRAVEALWFAAHFAATDPQARRALLDRAVARADAAAAAAPAGSAEAGEAQFWRAIAWGEWSMAHGSWAALTHGAVGRLRDAAEQAARLAPELRQGGGLRLLGRLHAAIPRLPFVTGWADRERGLALLREALAVSRREPRNLLFLAEALLERGPAERAEALALLRELAARRPDPAEQVEQAETLALAGARLAAEEGR